MPCAGLADALDDRADVAGRPRPRHQPFARLDRVLGVADQLDHLVDIGDREGEADEDMGPLARLAEEIDRAPCDDLFAEDDEGGDDVAQRQLHRPAAVERQRVDTEAGLQRREAIELVEHDVGHRIALQLDDDANAVAVGLVAQVRDALDQLLAHHLGDALDHAGLVDLVGHLGDDDRLAVLAQLPRHASCRA